MHKPVFSVVLPTCARPDALRQCLEGLAKLNYPRDDFEVVVIYDGSANSKAPPLHGAIKDLHLTVLHQERQGPAAARNTGASYAVGKYLAFIDDDCVPDTGWLAALETHCGRNPSAMVGGRTVNALVDRAYSDASQLLVDFLIAYHDASTPEKAHFFPTCNLAVPAEAFHALGGFDPRFTHAAGEDRDFCDRWHRSGGRAAYAPDAIVYHRHPLTLGEYLAQHFRYGRGALHFRRGKRRRGDAVQRTPAGFYLELIGYPLRRRRPLAGVLRAGLLLGAQGATAAGYLWERSRIRA